MKNLGSFIAILLVAAAVGCVDGLPKQNVSIRGKARLPSASKNVESEADQVKSVPSQAIELKFAFDSLCPESLQGKTSADVQKTVFAMLEAVDTKVCEEASQRLRKVTELSLASRELVDLSPLKGLPPNVISLDIFANKVSDLTPLTFSYLRKLEANNNQIVDIAPLKKLDLESLSLGNNPILDYGILNTLNKLSYLGLPSSDLSKGINLSSSPVRTLDLSDCKIQDLNTISLPQNIITLNLSYNPLTDINVLAQRQSLRSISLDSVPVINLTPLGNIPELLNLGMLPVDASDLSPLRGLKKLEQLSFRSNSDAASIDFSPLKGITTLKRVFIDEFRFSDLTVLGDSTQMEFLNIFNGSMSDVSTLARFTQLRELDLGGATALTNLNGLGSLPSLNVFRCNRCNLSDFAFLANSPEITKLTLASNPMDSVEVLRKLTKLTEVDLGGTSVTDLSPLNSLPNLKVIDLSGLPPSILGQIAAPQRIKYLRFSASGLQDLKGIELFTALESLDISSNRLADVTAVASLPLVELIANSNPLLDIKPLGTMKSLQKLDITGTQVQDLAPLKGLPLQSLFAFRIPLGTTVQKTPSNCPTDRGTPYPLERICRSP
ncbi:MAG TPA: hypothetical protein VE954_38405 [Oligoflexus sp.]|uniref:leucine-rich repeat domain-containing protein n=1 Tax=Oligoflexus sp. TaxID=1971216 RepID=UPI002D485A69|nr:hypothetical protein [Oligoflexus sp.]HYX39013.1 hypothetical protein [Oligoflexus sp.]